MKKDTIDLYIAYAIIIFSILCIVADIYYSDDKINRLIIDVGSMVFGAIVGLIYARIKYVKNKIESIKNKIKIN